MIEFSCVYCGQPLRVADELARKQIGCPACGHSVRVRPEERGKALRVSAASASGKARRSAEQWDRMSNEEIREAVLVPALPESEKRLRDLKRLFAPLLPRYDDLTLFTFGLALVTLLAVEGNVRQTIADALLPLRTYPVASWVLIVIGGALFSLVNVFLVREKSRFEKHLMLLFALAVTVSTGVSAGRPMLSGGYGLLTLFPLWNMVNGLLLWTMLTFKILDEDCLTGERATLRQIVLATVSVMVLVLVCHYHFRLAPMTTFSIAVAYTMSLQNAVGRFIGGWLSSSPERSAGLQTPGATPTKA